MRIAITGSSGLIGRALTQSLEGDGHEVVRIVRGSTREAPPGSVPWDIERGVLDPADLAGIDGAVNLAGEGIGEKRWTDEQKRRIRDSRVHGTALLARTLAELVPRPATLVSGSAIGVYGDRDDEQLSEASGLGSGFLAEVVVAWEEAAAPAEAAGLRVPRIRTGIVLAGEGGALERLARLCRFGVLGKLGDGRQWMSWISLRDEVAAIRYLLDPACEITGPVNLTAPGPVTNAVFTKALGRVLHRPTVLPIPSFGPKLLLGTELAEALLYDGQRVLPDALTDAGFEFRDTDLEPTLRDLLS